MKTEHIEIIRRQLGVALATISRYNSEHNIDIENISEIFYLKGDSKKKVLALLYMLSLGENDDAVKRYRKETGLNGAEYDSANLLEQYKVLLLTAMIYNGAFYAMALNYRGSVNAGLAIGEVEEDSVDLTQVKNEKIISLPVKNKLVRHWAFPKVPRKRIAISLIKRDSSANAGSAAKTIQIVPSVAVIRWVAAAAASFVLIFFFAFLFRVINPGLRPRISNTWVLSLIEPEKTSDKIAYVSMGDTDIRIGIISPLYTNFELRAKGAKDETGSTRATVNYYTRAIRADKNNANLYINRGIAYTIDGYLEAAVKDFNKAIELDPNNASAYYNRAIANAGMDIKIDTIVADIKTVISMNPDDNDAYYMLGVLYSRQYIKEKLSNLFELSIDAFGHIEGYKDVDDILVWLKTLNGR